MSDSLWEICCVFCGVARIPMPRRGRPYRVEDADDGFANELSPAAVLKQHLDRRQLTLALTRPSHQASVPLPPRSVHRASRQLRPALATNEYRDDPFHAVR